MLVWDVVQGHNLDLTIFPHVVHELNINHLLLSAYFKCHLTLAIVMRSFLEMVVFKFLDSTSLGLARYRIPRLLGDAVLIPRSILVRLIASIPSILKSLH